MTNLGNEEEESSTGFWTWKVVILCCAGLLATLSLTWYCCFLLPRHRKPPEYDESHIEASSQQDALQLRDEEIEVSNSPSPTASPSPLRKRNVKFFGKDDGGSAMKEVKLAENQNGPFLSPVSAHNASLPENSQAP